MARILEFGDIYFVFRPRVERHTPGSIDDVQRFYALMSPRDKPVYRSLVIGRKRLPDIGKRERNWAYIEKVADVPRAIEQQFESTTYQTKTRGERHQPAGRPVGEGVYAIVEHRDHAHLVYELELPRAPGEVQRELGLDREGSFIATVLNPERPFPPGAGPGRFPKVKFPVELQKKFGQRRFAPLEPAFLDHEGAEVVLIGAGDDIGAELGLELSKEDETTETAEIFNDLRMARDQHPRTLVEGAWE